MLGLGLSLASSKSRSQHPLLLDSVNTLFNFSFYKRKNSTQNNVLQLYNPDYQEYLDIPFDSSGFINLAVASAFLEGGIGKICVLYSQTGGNLYQYNISKMPIFNPSGLNGKPSISFSSGSFFEGNIFYNQTNLSFYSVCTISSDAPNYGRLASVYKDGFQDYDNTKGAALILRNGENIIAYQNNGGTTDNPISYDTPMLLTSSFSPTAIATSKNLTSPVVDLVSLVDFDFDRIRIGTSPDNNSWRGEAGEFILTRELISSDIKNKLYTDWEIA